VISTPPLHCLLRMDFVFFFRFYLRNHDSQLKKRKEKAGKARLESHEETMSENKEATCCFHCVFEMKC